MGWDAYTTVKRKFSTTTGKLVIEDKKINSVFNGISKKVFKLCGTCDGYLSLGGLDCSICADMLERATNMNCWNEEGYSPERVKAYNKNADWNFEYNEDDKWAYYSAKYFLETCSKLNLGINFSY